MSENISTSLLQENHLFQMAFTLKYTSVNMWIYKLLLKLIITEYTLGSYEAQFYAHYMLPKTFQFLLLELIEKYLFFYFLYIEMKFLHFSFYTHDIHLIKNPQNLLGIYQKSVLWILWKL